MSAHSDVFLKNSQELNKLKSGKICSVKLKFQSFRANASKTSFYFNLTTFDDLNVICCGNIVLDYAKLENLQKNHEIEFKHVLVNFCKQRPNHVKNDLNFYKKSEVYYDRVRLKAQILVPKPLIEKIVKQSSVPKIVFKKVKTVVSSGNDLLQTTPAVSEPSNTKLLTKKENPAKKRRNRQSQKLLPVKTDTSKIIADCQFLAKCTATLNVDSYVPNDKANFIFINCSTLDRKEVTVVASIKRHDEGTKLQENDLVKFVDAIRVRPKKSSFGLKVEKNTRILLLSRNGEYLDISKEMLEYKIIERTKRENYGRLKIDQKNCNTERGMIQTEFDEIIQMNSTMYTTNLLLNDGKLVKLVIDKEFGRWPKYFLKPKDRIILIAISEIYCSQEARYIRRGDYFDYDDQPVEEKEQFTCPICFEEFFVEEGRICCTPFENTETNEEIEEHKICVDCIKGIAKAALTDTPLAAGGIGLPCCVPECKNVFLMSEFANHLDADVHEALMHRMQHESILAANMDDLVTCPKCSTMTCVDQGVIYYVCVCGVRKCRHCPRLYDIAHYNKTCEEMDKLDSFNKKIDLRLSETVVRKCPKCHLQFVKESGCNKMTCRCGTLQCYLCRAVVKDYSHFCECDTKEFDKPCPRCYKVCPLFGDANQFDEQRLKQVRRDIESNQVPGFFERTSFPENSHPRTLGGYPPNSSTNQPQIRSPAGAVRPPNSAESEQNCAII